MDVGVPDPRCVFTIVSSHCKQTLLWQSLGFRCVTADVFRCTMLRCSGVLFIDVDVQDCR